jgi:hypothetical protein
MQDCVSPALLRKMITSIYSNNGLLCWNNQYSLATKEEYGLADRAVGSIFEALAPNEAIELAEGVFVLDEDLDPQPHPDKFTAILESAKEWGEQKYPQDSTAHHCAFANSVAYLVTGWSGGYGGPSLREHTVSYALAGAGSNLPARTNIGTFTIQYPDGKLPHAGDWSYSKALAFAEPIVYCPITRQHFTVWRTEENCFDDDPKDLEAIATFRETSQA